MTAALAADVVEALTVIAGSEWVEEARARWDAHAARPLIEVTVYGPFDAGKSTLIKRLLVEDGTPIPDWLTISARRETFELNEVQSGTLTFTDTPGVGVAEEFHIEIADDAVTLTDALILLLPPNLITSDAQRLLGLLTGAFYSARKPVPLPTGALIVAIAQMDTAGKDPTDDPDGYRELCERKRDELRALVGREGAATSEIEVLTASADPYGMVGRRVDLSPADYNLGREWDGIDAVRAALAALPDRKAELRTAAGERYWTWLTSTVAGRATKELRQLENASTEADLRSERAILLEQQLDAIVRGATNELPDQLYETLRTLPDASALSGGSDLAARAADRSDAVVADWLERNNQALARIAGEAQTELVDLGGRPSAAAYEDALEVNEPEAPEAGISVERARGLMTKLDKQLRVIAVAGFEKHTGMSGGEAREELERLRNLRGEGRAQYFESASGFRSVKEATKVRELLDVGKLAGEIAPALIELGAMALEELQRRKLEQHQLEKQQALRDELQAVAGQIAGRVIDGDSSGDWRGWRAAVEDLREAIHGLSPSQALSDTQKERIAELAAAIAVLDGMPK